MPRKMASVKNAKPSSENGMPIIGPANSMNRGHSRPSSNESTVPDTAPTANKTAVPVAHRFASCRYTASPVRRHRHSASTISTGIAIPISANTMWKPSEMPICRRAASRSDNGRRLGVEGREDEVEDQRDDERVVAEREQRMPQHRAPNRSARDLDVGYLERHADGEGEISEVEIVRRGATGKDHPGRTVGRQVHRRVPGRVEHVGVA